MTNVHLESKREKLAKLALLEEDQRLSDTYYFSDSRYINKPRIKSKLGEVGSWTESEGYSMNLITESKIFGYSTDCAFFKKTQQKILPNKNGIRRIASQSTLKSRFLIQPRSPLNSSTERKSKMIDVLPEFVKTQYKTDTRSKTDRAPPKRISLQEYIGIGGLKTNKFFLPKQEINRPPFFQVHSALSKKLRCYSRSPVNGYLSVRERRKKRKHTPDLTVDIKQIILSNHPDISLGLKRVKTGFKQYKANRKQFSCSFKVK